MLDFIRRQTILLASVSIALSACGGGGSESSFVQEQPGASDPSVIDPVVVPAPVTPDPVPLLSGVAPYTSTSYSFPSNGTGDWYIVRFNLRAFDTDSDLPVELSGLSIQESRIQNTSENLAGSQRYDLDSISCNAPLNAGLSYDALMLFDRSGSMSSNDPFNETITTGQTFVDRMGISDRASIAEFTSSISNTGGTSFLTPNFTSDQVVLSSALASIRSPDGGTPLWQAMNTSLQQFPGIGKPQGLIVFSDGEDTVGGQSPATVQASAQARNVQVYSINLRNSDSRQLDDIAEATGGAVWSTSEASDLIEYAQVLGNLLAQNYRDCNVGIRVSFVPDNPGIQYGYGPSGFYKLDFGFSYELNGASGSAINELVFEMVPGLKSGSILDTGLTTFSTDFLPSDFDISFCLTAIPGGGFQNDCTSTFRVTVCEPSFGCTDYFLASGDSTPATEAGSRAAWCPWEGPTRFYTPAERSIDAGADSVWTRYGAGAAGDFFCIAAQRFLDF